MKMMVKMTARVLMIVFLACSFFTHDVLAIIDHNYSENVQLMSSFTDTFQEETAYSYNEKLASDEFEGRQSGTEAINKTADWIQDQFKSFGLQPYQENSYFQEFRVPFYDVLSPLYFELTTPKETVTLTYRKDFIVYPYSGSGKGKCPVVFAGYGITSKEDDYDDYEKIDAKNKVVFILSGRPSFVSSPTMEKYNTAYKIELAFDHEAIGVIIANRPEDSYMLPMNMKFASGVHSSLPCLYLSKPTTELFFKDSQKSLPSLISIIEKTKKSSSIPLPISVSFEVNTISEARRTRNVIGYIPSIDQNSTESIVIGAHYDHLGKDQITGEIYRGANDNASGTAVMMELARSVSQLPVALKTNIVFIAFSGEEEGLIGSQVYVRQPLFPLDRIKAMINMDMVGTGEGVLYAGTSETKYADLANTIKEAASNLEININLNSGLLYPGSDHYPFHINKVPSVFFIQDNPNDIGGYHTTEDTMDSIDPHNLGKCGKLAMLTALALSDAVWVELNMPYELPVHPRTKLNGSVYGLEDTDYTVTIGDYRLPSDPYEPFEIISPLVTGENKLEFQVNNEDEKPVKTIVFILNAAIDDNLIADFNHDYSVNLKDLSLFARYYGMDAPLYQFRSQFDCNLDKKINETDLQILESVFGYSFKD